MTKYIGPKTDGENVATQADKLSLSSEAPDALTPDQTGAAGTATTAARSDHQHEILAGAAGTIQPDDTAAEGSATSFARADHRHAIAAASAGTITGTNAEGTSTSFARADHNHDISITPSWTAVTFANSWTDFGSGFETAAYFKDKFGVVYLKGLVKSGTLNGSAEMFTLPAGYRPAATHIFVVHSAGPVHGRVDILSDGKVVPVLGSNAAISISGICFPIS